MKIPTPNEFAKSHGYKPFPGRWEKWLSSVRAEIIGAQPVAGKHTTINEHPGKGTVINALDSKDRGRLPPPVPAGCPCLDVTFNDVIFDCPCFVPPGGGLSQLYTDGGNFNGQSFYTVLDSYDCATCARQRAGNEILISPHFHEQAYFTGDCSGSPIVDSEVGVSALAIARINGTWYVAARFFNILFFFGSASTLVSPIANQLTGCNATPTLLVNEFTTCYGWDATLFSVLAHGGTATLTPCVCPPPDYDSIDVRVAGLTLCPGFTDLGMNGTFSLPNAGSGQWSTLAGSFSDGGDPIQAELDVTCVDNTFVVSYNSAPYTFFDGIGAPPSVANVRSCSGGDNGEGGTAVLA